MLDNKEDECWNELQVKKVKKMTEKSKKCICKMEEDGDCVEDLNGYCYYCGDYLLEHKKRDTMAHYIEYIQVQY